MIVEFRRGVPAGCTKWLWANVGPGNISLSGIAGHTNSPEYAWFYERIMREINPQPFGDDSVEYIPTITVKDPAMALMFKLRWA